MVPMATEHRVLVYYKWRLIFESYSIDVKNDMVTVRTAQARKSTQIGGMPAKMLAKLMLSELAEEGLA
jgi:hypothetical protein